MTSNDRTRIYYCHYRISRDRQTSTHSYCCWTSVLDELTISCYLVASHNTGYCCVGNHLLLIELLSAIETDFEIDGWGRYWVFYVWEIEDYGVVAWDGVGVGWEIRKSQVIEIKCSSHCVEINRTYNDRAELCWKLKHYQIISRKQPRQLKSQSSSKWTLHNNIIIGNKTNTLKWSSSNISNRTNSTLINVYIQRCRHRSYLYNHIRIDSRRN